jgi:hypothetical protein
MPKISERRRLFNSLEDKITAKILVRQLQGNFSLTDLTYDIPKMFAYLVISEHRYLSI